LVLVVLVVIADPRVVEDRTLGLDLLPLNMIQQVVAVEEDTFLVIMDLVVVDLVDLVVAVHIVVVPEVLVILVDLMVTVVVVVLVVLLAVAVVVEPVVTVLLLIILLLVARVETDIHMEF
jgi:hypothetical protein